MPLMDGFETLPRIKTVCPKAKVVVFSAIAGMSSTSLTARGADLVVEKGDQIAAVVEAFATLVPGEPK